MTTCYLAIAAEYGSQDDPLVTLSYINDVLAPEAEAKIEEIFNQKADEFDSLIDQRLASIQSEIDSQLAAAGGTGTPSDALIEAVTAAVLEQLGDGDKQLDGHQNDQRPNPDGRGGVRNAATLWFSTVRCLGLAGAHQPVVRH